MFVSEVRINANRRNSQKSTGPKTEEGKERSRANALKHGLCATVVVVEDAKHVADRANQYFQTLRPQNDFHCWIVSEVAVNSVRIDRAERMDRRIRDKLSLRAELTWDDDRRLDAILLGSTLGIQPEVVVEQLRKTVHGCEWMMARWAMLKHVADVDKKWTPEQTTLAFDLLGTPRLFREGRNPGDSLDFDGNLLAPGTDLAEVARREIEDLKERREIVQPLDDANRALAIADMGEETDPELKRLRRHESTLHSRIRWCMKQLQYQSPHKEPLRGLHRKWLGDPEMASPFQEMKAPEVLLPSILGPELPPLKPNEHPPFDLEPDEAPAPGEVADIPAILKQRKRKKVEKAEARRTERRRRVEKLRA